jgi:hypothetical protein
MTRAVSHLGILRGIVGPMGIRAEAWLDKNPLREFDERKATHSDLLDRLMEDNRGRLSAALNSLFHKPSLPESYDPSKNSLVSHGSLADPIN